MLERIFLNAGVASERPSLTSAIGDVPPFGVYLACRWARMAEDGICEEREECADDEDAEKSVHWVLRQGCLSYGCVRGLWCWLFFARPHVWKLFVKRFEECVGLFLFGALFSEGVARFF